MTRMRGMYSTQTPPSTPMVWPKDRKEKKPLMEKHRRNRMNNAMNLLKDTIVRYFPNESARLEKADILERTVDFVAMLEKNVKRLETWHTANVHFMQEIGAILNRPEAACLPILLELKQVFERNAQAQCFSDSRLGFPRNHCAPYITPIQKMNRSFVLPPLFPSYIFPNLEQPTVLLPPVTPAMLASQSKAPTIESHVSDVDDEVDVESVEATEVTTDSSKHSITQDSVN
ncbi:HLH domain containing protein [Aphelenchoides besseyi]|nr:HLH domain containing protein [Aphelenchoides besseyi]